MAQSIPSVLQIPRGRIKLVSRTLPDKCEQYAGLHDIIKDKFLDIVNKWFKAVPSAPDFYFYCPDYVPMENNVIIFLVVIKFVNVLLEFYIVLLLSISPNLKVYVCTYENP